MPEVSNYDNEKDWMADCVPTRIEEGDEQKQAVAVCLDIWRKRAKARGDGQGTGGEPQGDGGADLCVCPECGAEAKHEREQPCTGQKCPKCGATMEGEDTPKALEFDMLLTKAEKMADGRTRWQARANTGKWDLERERFDGSFWGDIVHNFSRVQEAMTKGEDVGLPVPILDIAHYSFRLPADKRNLARVGYPIKLWQDGQALMAQGYFDDTPLGRAAAKAAASRPVAERRVSVGVWPDWGRVELDEDGKRTYRGGRDRAYLDHLAMTAHPTDPGTILEVKSMTEQKQDALDVLGEEAEELVAELEAATSKAQPEGAIVKGDSDAEAEQEQESEKQAKEQEPEAKAEGEVEPEPDPVPESVTMEQLRGLMQTLFESFRENLNERLEPMEAAVTDIAQIKAEIDALGATETEKVKAAIDSDDGSWFEELCKTTVQRREPVKGEGPQETTPNGDPFYQVFPGLKPPGS